jgi:hypothetical protein
MKLLIDIPGSRAEFVLELLQNLSFVKAKPLSKAKAERIERLLQGLQEVEEVKSGKRKPKLLKDLVFEG